jgi:hypothetical protein
MPHWIGHALVNVLALALGVLFGIPIGCDIMRRRCARQRQAEQLEQASDHVTHGLRVVGRGH